MKALRRALRSRGVIVAELAAIAAAGAAMTVLRAETVLYSPWFAVVVALTTVTLAIVLWDQWRRAFRRWATSRARLRLVGTPLFHLGLLLVIVAGLLRALLGRDAVVDLVEGEELPASAGMWAAEWGGPLSRPFAVTRPVVFERLEPARYPSGELEMVRARLVLGAGDEPRPAAIAVNAPLAVGGERLYLTTTHGPAALIEVVAGGRAERVALLLRDDGHPGVYEGAAATASGLEVRVRGLAGAGGALPRRVETRVLRDEALLWVGGVAPGEVVPLSGGARLLLHDVRYWAQFRGSRDRALGLAYAGFALVVAGAMMMFGTFARAAVVVALAGAACGGGRDDARAGALVRAYNDRVVLAYRAADPQLVEEVAGPEEAKRLTGLIGVKLDQGLTLDAILLELEVRGVARRDGEVLVSTRERWAWTERRVGSGDAVGAPSEDRYELRYRLGRAGGRWKVLGVEFAAPPQVGRARAHAGAPARVVHGVEGGAR